MNIEDMIMNGASEEAIEEAIAKLKEEKAKKEEANQKAKAKEELLAEGRAYLINAALAYVDAFDLNKGEPVTDEDVKEIEKMIKQLEAQIPLYIKLIELREKFDDDLFKGMF